MSLIGYARVSRLDQDPALQERDLRAAGCETVYIDRMSGVARERPELARAMQQLQGGDTLVVWKLDRLGRSLRDLIDRVVTLDARGVNLRCLTQPIDTTTAGGRLVFAIFGAVAEFERELIRERTQAGLDAARAKGRLTGPPQCLNGRQKALAQHLLETGWSVRQVAEALRVSPDTVYRRVGRPAARVS